MKKLSILLLVSIILQACGPKCPPSEKIGTVQLHNESLSYFPYKTGDTLVFKNAGGNMLKFYQPEGVRQTKNMIAVKKICSEFKFDGKSTYKYYEGIGKSVWFKSDKGYSVNIGLLTDNLLNYKQLMYDKLIVGLMKTGSIGRFELVTKKRFSQSLSPSEFNITNKAYFMNSIQIGPKTFHNVWTSGKVDGRIIYYNKTQGLVGFSDGKNTYYLDKIIP